MPSGGSNSHLTSGNSSHKTNGDFHTLLKCRLCVVPLVAGSRQRGHQEAYALSSLNMPSSFQHGDLEAVGALERAVDVIARPADDVPSNISPCMSKVLDSKPTVRWRV